MIRNSLVDRSIEALPGHRKSKSKSIDPDVFLSHEDALTLNKSAHALAWIKRKLKSVEDGSDSLSQTYLGSISLLRESFKPGLDTRHLKVEVISGGITNIALRVYDSSSTTKYSAPSSRSPYPSSVFVKVAMPSAKLPKKLSNGFGADLQYSTFSVNRMDREFLGLEHLQKLRPGSTVRPLLCDFDDVAGDGSKYLVCEYLDQLFYDQYLCQFHEGSVGVGPAQALGKALARLHFLPENLGKDDILDRGSLECFIENTFERTLAGMKSYVDEVSFIKGDGTVDVSAARHSQFLKEDREVIRCVGRVMENAKDPPPETGTFVHFDAHFLNVLVKEGLDESSLEDFADDDDDASDSSGNTNGPPAFLEIEIKEIQLKDDDPDEDLIKLIDFEFSNWGPAGADVGLFIAGATYYAIAHILLEDESAWKTMISSIRAIWQAYEQRYKELGKDKYESQQLQKTLDLTAREAVGWAGFYLWKLTSPTLFKVTCEHFYKMPDGLDAALASYGGGDETGHEAFRDALSKLAVVALKIGFGDAVCSSDAAPPTFDTQNEPCVLKTLLNEIAAARSKLRTKLDAVVVAFGRKKRSSLVPRRKSSIRDRKRRSSHRRRASSLREDSRRLSDSSMLVAMKEMEVKTRKSLQFSSIPLGGK